MHADDARTGWKFSDYSKTPKGLVCSVCKGAGSVDPFSLKLQNRFLPFFAMGFVVLLLIFLAVSLFVGQANFEKIIGFAGTLIGSITGYYFGGKHIESSSPSNPPDIGKVTPP